MSQAQVNVRKNDAAFRMAMSDWVASHIEEDEVIAKTMDHITACCGRGCEDEVSSWLYDIIGRAADVAAGLVLSEDSVGWSKTA